jgi:hypothetical protein
MESCAMRHRLQVRFWGVGISAEDIVAIGAALLIVLRFWRPIASDRITRPSNDHHSNGCFRPSYGTFHRKIAITVN